MNKRIITMTIALLMISSMLLTACGGKPRQHPHRATSAPVPATAAPATVAPAAAPEPVTIDYLAQLGTR